MEACVRGALRSDGRLWGRAGETGRTGARPRARGAHQECVWSITSAGIGSGPAGGDMPPG